MLANRCCRSSDAQRLRRHHVRAGVGPPSPSAGSLTRAAGEADPIGGEAEHRDASHGVLSGRLAISATYGRGSTQALISVYAMRMAAVFTLSVSTVGLRTSGLPRWVSYLG